MASNVAWDPVVPVVRKGPAPGVLYAGLVERTLALVVDLLVYLALVTLPYVVVPVQGSAEMIFLIYAVTWFVYFGGLWAWRGWTVGMRLFGLSVVIRKNGERLGVGRSMARALGLMVNLAIWFISVLAVLFSRDRRSPADALAGSLVIKRVPKA